MCRVGYEYKDIGFLIDASGSIVEDAIDTYGLLLQFVKQIIGRIDVGSRQNLIGLVQFSSTVETIFNLSTYANRSKAEIYCAVDDMLSLYENTNIALGLRSLFTGILCNW